MPQIRAIVRAAEAEDYRLSAIVRGIAASDAFRLQAVAETEPAVLALRDAVDEGG